MKNKLIIFFIVVSIIVICILSYFVVNDNKITNDEKKFRLEYESFNDKVSLLSKKEYKKVKIIEDNNIVYNSSKDIIELLKTGTGIIYFGFPECPWCRNMIEPLIEVASESSLDINYYNAYQIRDEKDIDEDGKIITRQEGTKDYYKILELLGDNASVYDGLDDDSIKRLYFPTVVFVKNGNIVDIHVSTVDSQKDPYKKLTKKQIKELKKIYKTGINKMNDKTVCTGKDAC